MKPLFFVYIIQSKKDESYYIGQCDDLDCRLSKHNDGQSIYTSSKLPWRFVFFEAFATLPEALLREKQIKAKNPENIFNTWLTIREHSIQRVVEEVPNAFRGKF